MSRHTYRIAEIDGICVVERKVGEEWIYVSTFDTQEVAEEFIAVRQKRDNHRLLHAERNRSEAEEIEVFEPQPLISPISYADGKWKIYSSGGYVGYYDEEDYELKVVESPATIPAIPPPKALYATGPAQEDYLDPDDLESINYVYQNIGLDLRSGTYRKIGDEDFIQFNDEES